jgi:ABC-type sugar transport system ATPase subunit
VSGPFFAARGLAKRFGDRLVLQDVSFEIAEGEIHGIMGPNGAGKTTCFHVLTGAPSPDAGRVLFDGRDITGLAPRHIARLGIARSFQLMNLFDDYSALENAVIATRASARAASTRGATPWAWRPRGTGARGPRRRRPRRQGGREGEEPVVRRPPRARDRGGARRQSAHAVPRRAHGGASDPRGSSGCARSSNACAGASRCS